MNKPLFSVVLITKNEANCIARALESLTEFRERGGEVVILDTGSTDKTVEIASAFKGVRFTKGEFHMTNPPQHVVPLRKELNTKEVVQINKKFLVKGEPPIVKKGDGFFHFSAARNMVTFAAKNNFIFTMDADEVYSTLDIDAINAMIKEGVEQLEYQFTFSFNPDGSPLIQFVQSKAFDRRKLTWNGVVHEVLGTMQPDTFVKRTYVGPDVVKLDHHQEAGKEHRSNYLVGLAYDCYMHPEADRQSFYFARELFYSYRYASAIQEFKRHIAMDRWVQEKAQSMIFIGDCYGALKDQNKQVQQYSFAFHTDPSRREALIKLAYYYMHYGQWQACASYAKAALEIPLDSFYGNDMNHYRDSPHFALYRAYGWLGRIPEAQEHITKALEYAPYNPDYIRDTAYYFEYKVPEPMIEGWMRWPELLWLYETAKKYNNIVEVGSFQGRSTHALLSGSAKIRGRVTAIDTWEGSADPKDLTHTIAKEKDILKAFIANVGHFENLTWKRKTGSEAAKEYADKSIDMVFIDAGHTYNEVKQDIADWYPKAKYLLCGHDYDPIRWPEVVKAVDEMFGKPHGVVDSIWYVSCDGPTGNTGYQGSSGYAGKNTKKTTTSKTTTGKGKVKITKAEKGPVNGKFDTTGPETNLAGANFKDAALYPTISFIIPQLGRPKGLERCIESIKNLHYPQEFIEIHVIKGPKTVPQKVKEGLGLSTGQYIVYAANDMYFKPECITQALAASIHNNKGLVSFNEGPLLPDKGNICTHFMIRRDLIEKIGGDIFDTRLHHVGVDNLLWHKAEALGEALYCEAAVIVHEHFSKEGGKMDKVYEKGWSNVVTDRKLLDELLTESVQNLNLENKGQ